MIETDPSVCNMRATALPRVFALERAEWGHVAIGDRVDFTRGRVSVTRHAWPRAPVNVFASLVPPVAST